MEWFAYRDWPRGGYSGSGPSSLCECSKDMLYTQSNNAMFLHCNVLGGTCVDLPTGAIRACCATKTCAGTSATTCYPNPGGSPKKGTHCLLGIAYDFDCAPMGQTCSPVQGQLCVATVDCAKNVLHSACNSGKTTVDPCRLEGSQCNAGYAGACQGNSLLVCVDGYKVPVDCTSIGFDLCGKPPLNTASGCMYAL